jgi:hypothetical protein
VFRSRATVSAFFVHTSGSGGLVLMHGDRPGAKRKIGYAGLTLALSLLVSTTYHLGYAECRDADLRSSLIGTVMANSATVLTGNPPGAFLTHTPRTSSR